MRVLKTALARAPPLLLSQSKYAQNVARAPPIIAQKQATLLQADYTSRADLNQALLQVSQTINQFFADQQTKPTSEGVYSAETLAVYDTLVWEFNSPFLWRIYPQDIHDLYEECCSRRRHAEVAVGTGLFLTQRDLGHVSLLDLNPNTLDTCAQRLGDLNNNLKIDKILYNVLEQDSNDKSLYQSFDSVGANFLIHCLHGGHEVAVQAFSNMAQLLSEEGVFFGSTILGQDLLQDADEAGLAAVTTIQNYNEIGIFGCSNDSYGSIARALHQVFEDVEVWRVGYCAVWKARRPKQ